MSRARWKYAIAGVGVLLLAGVVYAWSVLSVSIAAEYPDWSRAKLSVTFTVLMALFCIGQISSGFIGSRLKPRYGVWAGAALLAAGFALSAYMRSAAVLYLGFGVLCGFGSGFAYIAVMGSVVKWFPDKRGLVSGILLMGFGLSSFIIGKAFQAFTPDVPGAWRTSFLILGGVTFAVLFVCGFFIERPAEDAEAGGVSADGLTTGQMLKRPEFWLYYLWQTVLTCGGLMVISQASGILAELPKAVTGGAAATIVGLISIANGVGRVLFGSLYDKRGRKMSMLLICLLYAAAVALMFAAGRAEGEVLIICAFLLLGLGYGGIPVSNSAFVGERFGMAHYQTNFPVCNSAMLPASFGGAIAGALYDSTGAFAAMFAVMLAFTGVGALCEAGISAATRKKNI
jgi:OFA family oxalate/formate antiporter-like MFS transporter